MRLEGHTKMGFYPTPEIVMSRLRRHLQFPEELFSALDPCAGEGITVRSLTDDTSAVTHGVELDGHRAAQAKDRLDHVIQGDLFRTKISKRSVSLLLLNPPYADGVDGRLELSFLKAAHPLVQSGGVLIYIIPQNQLTRRVCRVLTAHLDGIRIYRFPDGEFERFRQIVVLGVRRKHAANRNSDADLQNAAEGDLPVLPVKPEQIYEVPPSPRIPVFRSTEIDLEGLSAELTGSALGRDRAGFDASDRDRPPVPLHKGHLALLLAAGELDGVVGRGKNRHIVRGHVTKTVRTTHEANERGDELIRETEQFQVQIKMLTRDGEMRMLT